MKEDVELVEVCAPGRKPRVPSLLSPLHKHVGGGRRAQWEEFECILERPCLLIFTLTLESSFVQFSLRD